MKTTAHADVDVFTAVAHPVRRQILDLLSNGDQTVKNLAKPFEMSRPAISQHLRILLDVQLVEMREEGREHYYHLRPERLTEIDTWLRHYRRFWESKLDALSVFLQAEDAQNTKDAKDETQSEV